MAKNVTHDKEDVIGMTSHFQQLSLHYFLNEVQVLFSLHLFKDFYENVLLDDILDTTNDEDLLFMILR